MARLLFEIQAARSRVGALANGAIYVVYSDASGTVAADIAASVDGTAISGSVVTTADIAGLGPGSVRFYGPPSGVDTLYIRSSSDATLGVQKVRSDFDQRLDALEVTAGGALAVSQFDAKGDLLAASAADTAARLAVGTNGQILVADSSATAGIKWFSQAVTNVRHAPYNAVGDGVTDDTAAIQAAIDQFSGVRGGTVFLPQGAYKVTTLNMKTGVALEGAGERQSFASTLGATTIVGTAPSDVVVLPEGSFNISFRNLSIVGGRRNVSSTVASSIHVHFDNVTFGSVTDACVYVEGAIERWKFRNCYFSGGNYGFRHENVVVGGVNYLDKTDFIDCIWAGQLLNAVKIHVNLGNTVTWINPIFNSSYQHAVWLDGGIRAFMFVNPNMESNGHSGKKNRTTLTGTVTSGATSGTLASATGWATGDTITIAGAGASGVDFEDTVTISGTAATWSTPTSTTVTDPKVTNAIYDDFYFDNSIAQPTRIAFIGGIIGGEGLGKLRYAVNNAIGADIGFFETATGSGVPVYDPAMRCSVIGGSVNVRQTATLTGRNPLGIAVPTQTGGDNQRAYMTSSPGGNLDLFIVDSNVGGTGTYGEGALRILNSNRDAVLRWGWDGTNRKLGFYNTNPQTKPAAYTQSYATASRTHAAYTSDPESSAYTGAADGEAKLADLNALRVAYENLRVRAENSAQVLNQLLDDLQLLGLLA